jgi:YfiH family protein
LREGLGSARKDASRNGANDPLRSVENSIYRVSSLERFPGLVHGISTRLSPQGEDWNLSIRRGTPQHPPSPDRAFANRTELARALGVTLDRMVGCYQVHGTGVAVVGDSDAGRGMSLEAPPIEGCDAMVTATPDVYLLALSADCPPIFFHDPVRRVVGLAHSGWKGTVDRIAAHVVETMARSFGSEPRDIVAAIGPGIGPCCYNVYPQVADAVEAAFPDARRDVPVLERRGEMTYFNLWEGIRRALLDAGLQPEKITCEGVCTSHNVDTFYSHRGEQGQCGLFGALLGMRE